MGIDSRGPASLYMMSESRISWINSGKIEVWDHGKKVFAFNKWRKVKIFKKQIPSPYNIIL